MESNIFYELLNPHSGPMMAILYGLIVAVAPLVFIVLYALVIILGELKVASWVQDRLGPMRTGPWGILQPIADVLKLLQKEDIVPDSANRPLFNIAPYIMFTGAFAAYAAIPFSAVFIGANINLGLFYVFAVSAFAVIGIVMGGWASNNKYSLIGAMRAAAQMVSYEIPIAVTLLTIAAYTGTLDLQEISTQQAGGFWNWNILGGAYPISKIIIIPFMVILFVIYLISSLAETNRIPFDIPEGESEIIAGYHTEYSGMKFAMFLFAEYANMFVVSALIVLMFFGGWQSPFGDFLNHPVIQIFWFIAKCLVFVFIQLWLRWTLPRLRVDQLMYVGWKALIPIAFVCFFIITLWTMFV